VRFQLVIASYKRPELLLRLLMSIKDSARERIKDISTAIYFDNNDTESCEKISKYPIFFEVNGQMMWSLLIMGWLFQWVCLKNGFQTRWELWA
jgi:hypothetical protein